jgi:hypothetical protein
MVCNNIIIILNIKLLHINTLTNLSIGVNRQFVGCSRFPRAHALRGHAPPPVSGSITPKNI